MKAIRTRPTSWIVHLVENKVFNKVVKGLHMWKACFLPILHHDKAHC
jgi:hypothetical protein